MAEDTVAQRMEIMILKYIGMVCFLKSPSFKSHTFLQMDLFLIVTGAGVSGDPGAAAR